MEPRAVSSRDVVGAAERVYDSGQKLLLARIDLLVAEIRLVSESALLGLGALLIAVVALFWLSYSGVELLSDVMSRAAASALVGLADAILAALAVALSRRRAQRLSSEGDERARP